MKSPFSLSVIISIVLHAGLFIALVWSVDFERVKLEPTPSAPIINATAVDINQVTQQVERLKNQQQAKVDKEKQRIAKAEKDAEQARKKRLAEEKRIKQLELEKRQQENAKKKADEQARRAKEKQKLEQQKAAKAEAERVKKEEQRKVAEAAAVAAEAERVRKVEQQKKAEEAARKAEETRKRKEEEARVASEKAAKAETERKRQAEIARQEAEFERQMQSEMAVEANARHQRQVLGEVDKYRALIMSTIQRNWLIEPSMLGRQCQIQLTLASSGFVTSIGDGKGDRAVCESARRAIKKAVSLPVSKDPDVFAKMKNITLTLKPE
ncbi:MULTISPECIES: cell envelope integrity protein TolA [unclassified Agarivorans]|uniref:cell envelope integrity protein TolA n=1 Tax=unclassified Agarivorans TaxID=2636026 RepID=UPI0026E43A34|nr:MULTISPECIES: cell envelope integrity protein TolA [unclassified Agarivorans]MDO6685062.1 cell envelope integrity protein TolA [Agarivorans sp. 3_MG-2023]MDO6717380.1 cell envelope integrity protein TolA [Agarivorans sp. 2_MG-2023]